MMKTNSYTTTARLFRRAFTILALAFAALTPAHAVTNVGAPGDADTLDANFAVNSTIGATAVQADGKILVAGTFATVGGTTRNNIARLNADGTLDAGFNPNANGNVVTMAVQADGKILIGGIFTTVGGTTRNNIARLNADGTLDVDFNPNANNSVVCLAVQADGKIWLGGFFSTMGGTPRGRIARLNADGTLDAGFSLGLNNSLSGIAVQGDGKTLIWGSFNAFVGANVITRVARFNVDGTLDAGFNPNPNSGVTSAVVQADGKILIAGNFTTVGGTTRNNFARLNADGTLDAGFNPTPNSTVYSLGLQADGKILIAGTFTTVGGTTRNSIARLNADGTLDVGFNPNANIVVYNVALQADGKILLAGGFTTVGGTARYRFARLLNDSTTQTVSAPDTTQVVWTRTGAGPELTRVTFELSTDGGTAYTPLAAGTRVGTSANWQLAGLSLPASGHLRARGWTANCFLNANGSGLIEQVATFSAPTTTVPTVINPIHSPTNPTNTASLGGMVSSDGGDPLIQRGVVFSRTSVNADPLIGGTGVTNLASPSLSLTPFSVGATGLLPSTSYSYKAYGTNAVGTGYSSVGSFTTIAFAPEIRLSNNAGQILASGDTISMGSRDIGTTGSGTIYITNLGNGPLTLTGTPKLAFTGSSDFSVNAQPSSATVVPGNFNGIFFHVRFTPTSAGPKTATLTILNDDSDEGTSTLIFTGTGVVPAPLPTVVTTTANTGAGSLRQAVLNANANPGADVITFDPTVFATAQTIALTSALAPFTGDATVTGPAAGVNVQASSTAYEVFRADGAANVSFAGLTITSGSTGVNNNGTGTVTVSGCEFSASTDTGISNATGTLVVNDSTIRSTYSLINRGTATMTGCTVIAGFSEAALNNSGGGTLTLINCTALDMNGTVLFNNYDSGSTVTAIHCTLIENAQSDNVGGATLTLKNSIFRTNTANTVFTNGGGNLVINSTGNLAADLATLGLDPAGLQANGGTTLTIALLSGPAINGGLAANIPVGLTTDQRGSGFSRTIGNPDSGAFEAAAPVGPTVGVTTGGAVPGAPVGTTFAGATGLPGANEGDIGATNIKLPNGKTVKALVNSTGIIIKVGDPLVGAGGAEIAKLDSMSFGVFLAELKVGTGTPAATLTTNKVVCFEDGSGIQVLARSGEAAPGGSTFKSFRGSCGDAAGNVFIAASLNDGTTVDGGLWTIPAGGAMALLVKEGQTLDLGNGPKRVNAISSFPAGLKSQAEGRVHYGSDSVITRITLGADHALVVIPATATSSGDWTVVARSGGDAPGAIGKYSTLGLPAAEGTNVVFTAKLKIAGAVTLANNAIIVAGGAVIARKGGAAPGTSGTFTVFEDVAAGSAGQACFTANITGATTATDSGLWEYRSSALSLVARQGDAAPDLSGVTIVSITRFAHPGGGLGPVFIATLGGASATTNVGLFGVPATGGSALNFARTGDLFDVGGTMRKLTAISALKMDAGNEGVARGYTDTSVFMIGSFGATRTALIEFPVAP